MVTPPIGGPVTTPDPNAAPPADNTQAPFPPTPGAGAPPSPFGVPSSMEDDIEFEADLSDEGLVPEGYYKAKIVDVAQEISSKGDPMYVWTFVLVETEHAGRSLKLWTVRTPAAMWKLSETLVALGLGAPGQKARFKRSQALNTLCTIEVTQEPYNGRITNSVASVSPPPEGIGFKAPTVGVPAQELPF